MPTPASDLSDCLKAVDPSARKLFSVIVREAFHGPIHGKADGVATPAEILEACGLDVGDFYSLLNALRDSGLIEISGTYPFEEVRLSAKAADARRIAEVCLQKDIPPEEAFVNIDLPSNT